MLKSKRVSRVMSAAGTNVPGVAPARTTTSQRLAAELRAEICAGHIPPGSPLRETKLARDYSASRHIIREALRLLVSEGLAEYASFKGVRVASMSADDVRDIYQARRLIELGALPLVTPDTVVQLARLHGKYHDAVLDRNWDLAFAVDIEFHAQIVAMAQSHSLGAVHRDLFQRLQLAHMVSPEFREFAPAASVGEHAQIIVAMQADDLPRASYALDRHLKNSERSLASCLNSIASPANGKGTVEPGAARAQVRKHRLSKRRTK